MLVPIVFIIAFMLALTGVVLENSLRAAKVTLHTAVARYADITIADGVADFTHGLSRYVERHGTSGPWPRETSYSAEKSACDSTPQPCLYHYIIAGTISAASGRARADGADAAPNLQAAVIDEQRVSATVTVTLSGPGGIRGTRTRLLTYRVFDSTPYAVISGSRDTTTVNGDQSAAQGDSGGTVETKSSGAATPDEGADTRIHVRLTCRTMIENVQPFVNDQQVPGNDGLPWGNAPNAAYETPCTTIETPADAFANGRWTNGDTNSSGWTQ